jgi:pSer/pThr/pTyr-binding forkhead associated (FHA) protein
VFKLTIEDDEGKTTVVPLARDEMSIGRLEGNTIRLTERNVSRRHARLVRQNGALFIEDLSSFTGVRVNGTKIASPTALREGDEVQIGDYRLALRGEKPAAPGNGGGDRPTMPSMPAGIGPMATVGGSVAIPTRASVAAMAVQPLAAPAPTPTTPQPAATTTQPLGSAAAQAVAAVAPALAARKSGGAPAVAAPTGTTAPGQPAPVIGAIPSAGAAPAAAPAPTRTSAPAQAQVADAAPEVSEAQPTIPIRALGDKASLGPAARLCALTTDIAGTEYPLDRPSLVIGRTDENDVVVNHRSISRHHAKIVRDGDHYTIVDLQSANGVRVNGEDYERIELNAGDIIELGHVKLRFIGSHESFVFDPRQSAGAWRPPIKLIAAAGGAIAAIAAVTLFLHRGSHADAPVSEVAVAPPPAAVAPPPPAPPPPEPEIAAPPPAPAPAATTPAATLAEARDAAGAEDWDKARAALDRLGTGITDPSVRKEAVGLRRRVDTERQAAVAFAQFDEASGAKNYQEVLARFQEIPQDSVYKKRARPRFEEARSAIVAEHLATAERARAAGRCGEVRAEADEVIRLEPRNLLAKDMVRLCRPRAEPAAVAARPAARSRPSAALVAENRAEAAAKRAETARGEPKHAAETAHAEPARSEAAAEPAEAPDPDALMKQAREAWMRQQCGAAIDLSRKALHAKPGMTDAYQIIAVCSCTLKDAEAAGRAYAKLDDKNRNLVHALCQKNGISVGE